MLGCKDNIAATITPHHLLANRNHMLVGGIKPHYYCLPVLKRQYPDQKALLKAATSGNPKFFLGTDSAPHDQKKKESTCGCAGIFSAHAAIELYAEAFDGEGAIERLRRICLYFWTRLLWLASKSRKNYSREGCLGGCQIIMSLQDQNLTPFFAGAELSWRLLA